MATKAQIEANRKNAQKSTGPRSPEGKARSSHNALKHGLRAEAVISTQIDILGEDPNEFAALLQDLVEELKPVGILEQMCVETVALCQWRLRRVIISEMGYIWHRQREIPIYLDNPSGHACLANPKIEIMDKLSRYEAHLERQLQRALNRLSHLQTVRLSTAKNDAPHSPTPKNSPNEANLAREIVNTLLSPSAPESNPSQPAGASLHPEPSQPLDTPHERRVPSSSTREKQSPAQRPDAVASAPKSVALPNEPNPLTPAPAPVCSDLPPSTSPRQPSIYADVIADLLARDAARDRARQPKPAPPSTKTPNEPDP